jgi:hypothetical protein
MLKSILTRSAAFVCVATALSAQQFLDQTSTRLPVQAVWSEEVDAADLDGDGDLDLVYGKGNGFSSAGTAQQNKIHINDGTGVFTDQTATLLPVQLSNTKDLDLLDVDGDGDFDLVVANAFGQQPRLYLNGGVGVFTDVTATHLPALTLNSFAVAGGDLDADGDLDLIFTDSGATTFGGSGGQPRCFINDGTGHFANETTTRLPVINITSCVDADLSDVDNDFDLDLIVVSRDGSPSRLFLNNGSGVFTTGTLPADGTGTYEYATGDVDGDNDADIFVIGQNGLAEGVFRNNPLGTFALVAGGVVSNPASDDNDASLGDIDNDGDFDVAIAALGTVERFLVNSGAGIFTYNAALVGTTVVDSSLDGEFADVDNDGDLDYVTAVGESGAFQNRIYINATGAADTQAPTFRLQVLGASTAAGSIPVLVAVKDIMATDGDPEYQSVTLNYDVNGAMGTAPMKWSGADFFRGVIPFAGVGQTVMYSVTCVDRNGTAGTSSTVTFSPGVNPSAPMLTIVTPGLGAVTVTIYSPTTPSAEEFLLVSTVLPPVLGSGPFFGLNVDAFNILFLPAGLPPLHDHLDATGLQISAFGPGSLPPGFTFDARAVIVAAPQPIWTNILRVAAP